MLYLGVLVLEFSHLVLERYDFPRLLKLVDRTSIVFVILGICLSTLHQSSLGTLFLATPYRLHDLWYSNLLPLLFLITSMGLGCLTISWVTLVVHWLYGSKPPMKAISGLGRIAAILLGVYAALRFGDIVVTGKTPLLLSGGWDVFNFWFEVVLSMGIPIVLLSRRRLRESPLGMFWISAAAIVGMSLNRVNVAGLATLGLTEGTYFPIWPEWLVTLGLLSAAGLVFLFAVERFRVYAGIDEGAVQKAHEIREVDPADWKTVFFRNPLASARVYSALVVLGIGLTVILLPENARSGVVPESTVTRGPQVVELQRVEIGDGPGARYVFPPRQEEFPSSPRVDAMLIDGNSDGNYVLFEHQSHVDRLEERGEKCTACHHMTDALNKAPSCTRCHTDMYLARDIFDHAYHVTELEGNRGCQRCHVDPDLPKVRANTAPCEDCHGGMRAQQTRVVLTSPPGEEGTVAKGYMDAMHGLCITCHENEQKERPEWGERLSLCTTCHRETLPLRDLMLDRMPGSRDADAR
jgi:hypothetical protein